MELIIDAFFFFDKLQNEALITNKKFNNFSKTTLLKLN